MNPENCYQPCPYCGKFPPNNFDDFDTCSGAYQATEKEYAVEILEENDGRMSYQETEIEETGFRCGGEARDWIDANYPDRDYAMRRVM